MISGKSAPKADFSSDDDDSPKKTDLDAIQELLAGGVY
jgi:hypothetical protein